MLIRLDPSQQELLRHAVATPVDRAGLIGAVDELYADFQRLVDARKPLCSQSGKCCRFDAYGHVLFVTPVELIAFQARLDRPVGPWDGAPMTTCPFQEKGLCSVHPARPFGCRVYFCDPTATTWQQEQYEHFHQRIKNLHARFDVPYLYVEWREALKALGWVGMKDEA
jgi:Fe-S-cluster containining protein